MLNSVFQKFVQTLISEIISHFQVHTLSTKSSNGYSYHQTFHSLLSSTAALIFFTALKKSMNSMDINVSDSIIATIMDKHGNFFKIDVNKKNSINYLRSKIQNDYGISLKHQYFECDDLRKKSDENQQDKETFENQVENNIDIRITRCDGKSFAIKVDGNKSFVNAMMKIEHNYGILLNRQRFTCSDSETLSDDFFYKQFENVCNDIKDCREDVKCMISAVENFDTNITCDNYDNDEEKIEFKEYSGNSEDSNEEYDSSSSSSGEEEDPSCVNVVEVDEEDSFPLVHYVTAFDNVYCFADGKGIKMSCFKERILILDDSLNAPYSCTLKAVKSIIPIILECELQKLELHKQSLTWDEYQFLTSSATIKFLDIIDCTIKYENGSTVTADKLFTHLPKLVDLKIGCKNKPLMFGSKTAKRMARFLLRSSKMQIFVLEDIKEGFDISAFTDFVMENTTVDVRLVFKGPFADDYNQKFKNFVEKIISDRPQKIPDLEFPWFRQMNMYSKYQKLHRRQISLM